MIKRLWSALVDWFEHGDLVPLLVVVSAVHYSTILAKYDAWPVAVAIGLLVDLGHYRWVRAASRYSGNSKREAATRWAIAGAMTAVSLAYHQRFYADWWLSVPLPLLIASLAWLSKVDRPQTSKGKAAASETQATVTEQASEPEPMHVCWCGYEARSQNALNGHKRRHAAEAVQKVAERSNGHKREKVEL